MEQNESVPSLGPSTSSGLRGTATQVWHKLLQLNNIAQGPFAEVQEPVPTTTHTHLIPAASNSQQASQQKDDFSLPRPLRHMPSWKVPEDKLVVCQTDMGADFILGWGAFGMVYKARLVHSDEVVALKVLLGTSGSNLRAREQALHEVAILREFHHPHIVMFRGATLWKGQVALITEFMEGGDLCKAIAEGRVRFDERGLAIALGIARGLIELHSKNVEHLDLKSSNIMLSRAMKAKIGDVGLSKVVPLDQQSNGHTAKSLRGTLNWLAPELLGLTPYREVPRKADIYSLGVILWEIATGRRPDRLNGRHPDRMSSGATREFDDLIRACVSQDPQSRPTAEQVLQQLRKIEDSGTVPPALEPGMDARPGTLMSTDTGYPSKESIPVAFNQAQLSQGSETPSSSTAGIYHEAALPALRQLQPTSSNASQPVTPSETSSFKAPGRIFRHYPSAALTSDSNSEHPEMNTPEMNTPTSRASLRAADEPANLSVERFEQDELARAPSSASALAAATPPPPLPPPMAARPQQPSAPPMWAMGHPTSHGHVSPAGIQLSEAHRLTMGQLTPADGNPGAAAGAFSGGSGDRPREISRVEEGDTDRRCCCWPKGGYFGGSRRKRRCLVVAGLVLGALLAALIAFVLVIRKNGASSDNTVTVVVQSSNTKQLWFEAAAADFNRSDYRTTSGQRIVVKVYETTSALDTALQPIVWSPADPSWIELAQSVNGTRAVSDFQKQCNFSTSIPVGFAMWRKLAIALGWPDKPISLLSLIELAKNPEGWESVGPDLAQYGDFKLGHGNPNMSNSGRLAFAAAIYAAGNTSSSKVLDNETIWSDEVVKDLTAMEQHVYHLGQQDLDLLNRMVSRGPGYLHAVASFESTVIEYNADRRNGDAFRRWNDTLVFIYPSDGTFWQAHPVCVLDDASWSSAAGSNALEAARMFSAYVTGAEQQRKAPQYGTRPYDLGLAAQSSGLNSTISLANGANPAVGKESVPALPYPNATILQESVRLFNAVKKPAWVVLIFDTSGSMSDVLPSGITRLEAAKRAGMEFVSSMDGRDMLLALRFSSATSRLGRTGRVSEVRNSVIQAIQATIADGSTALYKSILEGLTFLNQQAANSSANGTRAGLSHNYALVVMTDGEDTDGGKDAMQAALPSGEDPGQVHIWTIAVDSKATASRAVFQQIAARTNGKAFTAEGDNIKAVYREIAYEF